MRFLRAGLAALLLLPSAALACEASRWSVRPGPPAVLVTPCGEEFWSRGINVLSPVVPENPPPGRLGYDWRRYYPSREAWAAAARARAAAWGFDTAGAWSAPASLLDLPFIPNLELGRLARFHWFDPFDPATETRMRALARELTAPYRGDPRRIGYFVDNEVGWWGGALFVFYSAKPAASFTKRRWLEALQDRYASFAELARDFVPPEGVSSWEGLLAAQTPTRLRAGGGGIAAVRRWTALVAEEYYAMAARALRAADPEALLFGDRLPIYYDPVALRAMARHMDVLAINYNLDAPDGWLAPYFFDGVRRLTGGKPVLVSEWFYAARENRTGNRNNGHLMTVATQAERARGAAAATLHFAAVPEILGAHWFQWADHPAGGRGDGEDYNFGLVDVADRPYEALVAALAQANRAAPRAHAAARPPATRDLAVPRAAIDIDDEALADWPKPASLLPPLQPAAGEVAFGEAYLAWDARGLFLATVGQDYYDIDLGSAFAGPFPLAEAYRLDLGIDAGAGPRRFTLAFVPPRTKTRDHPPMAALLCAGAAADERSCRPVPGARAVYFGADQPRITAEVFLPWSALGVEAPPQSLRFDLAATAWHRSRWMSLSGNPPDEAMARPAAWPILTLRE